MIAGEERVNWLTHISRELGFSEEEEGSTRQTRKERKGKEKKKEVKHKTYQRRFQSHSMQRARSHLLVVL